MEEQELKEYYNKGILAYEKQNYDYAIEIFSQILLLQYDHIDARHYLHLSLTKKINRPKTSFIPNLISFINRFFLFLRADNFLKKDNIRDSLETLERLLYINPNDIVTLKKMAEVFLKKELTTHAISILEEAKVINPMDVAVLKKLGQLYLKKEDYEKARINYELVLKVNPHDIEALTSIKNLDALGTLKQGFGN